MRIFLTKTERRILKLGKQILKFNKQIDSLESDLLTHSLDNNSQECFSARFKIREMKESKEEILTLINNI